MTKKLFWGLAVLIILIGVSVFMLTRTTDTEPENVYKPLTPEEEELVQETIEKAKTPTAKPGYKLVQHGDHTHEVPITETDPAPQNVKPVSPVPKTKSGGLTYHAELLETNPVKALRLQAEERGHWSKEHIPPFPPDDLEAQEFARNRYLMHYYESIGDESNPIYGRAARAYISQMDVFEQYPSGAGCVKFLHKSKFRYLLRCT